MSRGSSQSWRGRAARPGPATQRGRAGGTTPGVRDPRYARPSLEPAGGSPLGHCGEAPPAVPSAAWRGALPSREPGGGVGWGGVSALSWGRGAPSRAGEGAGSPVWLRSRPRSDQAPGTGRGSRARPDVSPHTARLAARPRERECLTLTGGYGWVGGVGSRPSGFRRGREPRAGSFEPRGGVLAAGQPGKRGRRRDLGRRWREKLGDGP